ncbi:MAG: YihA family ribosome biogenesis GTP-binding protein [Bacteroidetes bacterium]|nr:YihA family ribosome biogenesis GTP-binding protein [Bacteroidota bacterium]
MIKQTEFIGSFTKLSQCPDGNLPEYAFIGRSNVGKSSLINMITQRKKLALVSHTPGKTKTLNYFRIDNAWYLVDLPGYGYAKVSKTDRKSWGKMIRAYLANRSTLSCVFILIDARIPPQKIDLEFINWLGESQIPFIILFTKVDKLKSNELSKNVAAFKRELRKDWDQLPEYMLTSSVLRQGRDELLQFISGINETISTSKN